MDAKTLEILEYPKILERLSEYCAFEASQELALAMHPTDDLEEARRLQAETDEALALLSVAPDTTIGGARDVRLYAEAAARNVVLEPHQMLDIKYTLIAARTLRRDFEKREDEYPHLSEIALRLPPPLGLVDTISQTLSENGEVRDSASTRLGNLRRDMRIVHDRLLSKLQHMVSDPKISKYLQENLVTQRDGRYVIPLRADYKGKIKAVVHDQSSSGATIFVEPLSVVDQNNQYRELQLEEREEVRRILAELSRTIGDHEDVLIGMVDVLAELDLAFARASYAEDLEAIMPVLTPIRIDPDVRRPGIVVRLNQARHPLLDPETVVPIDVELDEQTYALVITGPNTGGKTVTLKTIGLLVLMAQSGLHIPVRAGSELSLFTNVYADIGDEQSIEQSLSTFSGHITNIIRILEQADRRSLVILDELGAGTDPQEGAALARSLLTRQLDRGITTFVTTHHPELKEYAHATPGVVNASVEFDLETLQPTFRLTIGLPGRSNALAIAERLGLPKKIIEKARSELDPVDLKADDLLEEIHRQREQARQAREDADAARRRAKEMERELAERLEHIEDERREVLEEARIEAREEVGQIREELRRLTGELKRARQPLEVVKEVEEEIEQLEEQVAKPVEREEIDVPKPVEGPIQLGAKVRLRTLETEGVVTGLSEDEAEVQVGMLRVRARLSDLELKSLPSEVKPEKSQTKIRAPRTESPGVELDLRGKRADDALDTLDGYLERAYVSGMPYVRIIHGKGTGRLRDVVRQKLQGHPHITSFESGKRTEGGDGVTVAKLRK